MRQELEKELRELYRQIYGEKEAEQLLHSTLESTGFQIDKTETILYGVCADCRK